MVWFLIYNIFIFPAGYTILKLYSNFHHKLKVVWQERKLLFPDLSRDVEKLNKKNINILIHCASQGEFEEAKPLIKELKQNYSNINIVLSFFSPSGYKNYSPVEGVDVVSYLPFDSLKNVKKLYSIVNPALFIIVKHDIWPNHIWYAKARNIPVILIDAYLKKTLLERSMFVKRVFKNLYSDFDLVLTASQEDKKRFKEFIYNMDKVIVTGDTRFDQVFKAALSNDMSKEKDLKIDTKVFVAGSTWQQDDNILIPAIDRIIKEQKDFFVLLVPHEPSEKNIENLANHLDQYGIKYSIFSQKGLIFQKDSKVIIIDKMGILSRLYKLGDIAYVGGGFSTGVHNVLEPVVYGIPVFMGTRYDNSPEARELIMQKGAYSAASAEELYKGIMSFIKDNEKRMSCGKIAQKFIQDNLGATEKILSHIKSYLNRIK